MQIITFKSERPLILRTSNKQIKTNPSNLMVPNKGSALSHLADECPLLSSRQWKILSKPQFSDLQELCR